MWASVSIRRTTRASQTTFPFHMHCPHHIRFASLRFVEDGARLSRLRLPTIASVKV